MAICYEYKGQSFESKKDLQRFMMEEYIRENSSVPTSTEETQETETTEETVDLSSTINIETVKRYSNDDVKNNPDKIYVFGDNTQRNGTGGQATIRNNENAFGIATKLAPSMKQDAFMSDDDLESNKQVIDSDIKAIKDDGRDLVFPEDGFGTGLAKLKEKAPQTYEYLKQRLLDEFGFDNDTGQISSTPQTETTEEAVEQGIEKLILVDNSTLKDGDIVYDKNNTKFIFRGFREKGKIGEGSPRLERTDGSGEIAIPGINIELYKLPTPQTKTTEDLSQLSMDELRAKFAKAYKTNDASQKSAFSPTEEIFNRGNKTSNSFLSNHFVENTTEFFDALSRLIGTNNSYRQNFIRNRIDKEKYAKALLDKIKLKATSKLVDSDETASVLRVLGLIESIETVGLSSQNRVEFNLNRNNFEKLSLAKKISMFRNLFPDKMHYDFILSYFSVNAFVDPSLGKMHETVLFNNPGDKVIMDNLMDDFQDILFKTGSHAQKHKLTLEQENMLQSIAKDLILYDLAVNNFEFTYGAISKIYNKSVVEADPTAEGHEIISFLNQSIASVYKNEDLKSIAQTVTSEEMYDYDPEFIPIIQYGSIKGGNQNKEVLDAMGDPKNKNEKYFRKDDVNGFNQVVSFKIIERPGDSQDEASELPSIVKRYKRRSENDKSSTPFSYFRREKVEYSSQGNFVTTYVRIGTDNVSLSKVKKTTGKNVLNDQFQPVLGSLAISTTDRTGRFAVNTNFKYGILQYRNEVTPSYEKEDDMYHSLTQIATVRRTRNIKQIERDGNKLKNIFKKAGIKVNIVYDTELDAKGSATWVNDKEVTITINPELATDDTSPHEFSHIFADIVGLDNPVMKRAVSFLKGTQLWKEVKRAYPDLKGDNLAKEVIATAMGIAASKKLNKKELSTWEKIKNGIKAFFKRLFRFKSMNPVDELVDMMYNEDLSGYSARFNLEDNIKNWKQVDIPDAAMLDELEQMAEDKIYDFSENKVINSIYVEIQNKRTTLRRQGRPTRFIDKTIKKMKEDAGKDLNMISSLKEYHQDLTKRIKNLYDYVSKTMDQKVRNGNLTPEEEIQLSNAMYELSDNIKTVKSLAKHFAPYLKIWRENYRAEQANNEILEGNPNKKTKEEIINSHFDKNGMFKGEENEDLFGYYKPVNQEQRNEKFAIAMGIAFLGDITNSLNRIETELYGDGVNREGLLREYMNKQLLPLSSNPDFVEGEIKSLFKLRKTRYTLPYDETSIQMWLDALKDTNNPFVALAVKKYYEGLFMAKKRSQAKIREYKKRVEEFKNKGYSMDSLIDESGRFIDEINYDKYLEIREKYLVNGEGSYAEFHIKYHTWHPDYDEIKQNMIDTYGVESDEYQEWFSKNHGEKSNGDIYPVGSMSVPNFEVEEIRNKKFDQLSKDKEWLEFRNYIKELVRSQKGSMFSQLLDEGFIPAVPLKGDSIIEEIKSNADGFKESVKKLGKHFKGKFLPNVEEDAENKQYIITDEDNNIVDTVPIPFLKFLSKKEKPVFDSKQINSRSYLDEFNKRKEKYNIDKRREQGALVNKNLELTMEVFIGMTETYNYKKQQTSSLLLMRELVKATPLHRNKGLTEVLDFTNKKTTGKDAPALTEATNLLQHVDDWLKMVHYDKFDFADQDWQRNVARLLMSITSISSLGLNAFSAFNNVAYGNIQLFTERMAGEFFTTKSWRRASAIANKLPFYNFSTKPDDKDASIANFFDVVERGKELGDKKGGTIKEKDNKEKFINALFFMQNAGEIQMQNATLFSVLMETPVKVTNEDGTTTDGYLYDYMQNVEGNIFVPENVKVKSENGKWVTVDSRQLARIRGKVYSINQYMHGIYNKEDAGTINKAWIGRLAMHFKKWMRPGFNRRFGSRFGQTFWNETRESLDEGMYVGTVKFLAGVFKNARTEENMSSQWNKLDAKQKSNIIRTGVEMSAALSLAGLAFVLAKVIEGLEPEDDEYLSLYAMHYMTQRLYREQLTYSFRVNKEAKRTIQEPIASWKFVNDTTKSLGHVMGIPFAGTFMEDIFGNPYYQAGYKKGEHKGLYKLKQMIPLAKTYMQYKALDDTFEIRKQQ